jgi:hypothetical protein
MKKLLVVTACLMANLTVLAQNNSLNQFSFLLGGWEVLQRSPDGKTAKGKISEYWKKSSDSLIGKSYRHQFNGDSVLMETLVIKKIEGSFYYCSKVNGQNNGQTVNFKLLPINGNTITFENASHDFPQRIVYQNTGKDSLLAWIEGEKNGTKRKSEYPYSRIK